jgi:3-methyl-2-oxobutanoate hydroxymethyltransferase
MRYTAPSLRGFKARGEKFVMLTSYDAQSARIFDEAGVPVIFIGDTLGIFFAGGDSTVAVTMDQMTYHCSVVSRAVQQALVVGDLPFAAYHESIEQAVRNAARLVRDGGVQAVKLEGPRPEVVARIIDAEIPVIGHLGLTPQSVHIQGRNTIQARTHDQAALLVDNAMSLEAAGISALVLEAVTSDAAREVTEALSVPTIGIGAGPGCDAQVLITTEVLGLTSGPRPRFAKQFANLGADMRAAVDQILDEVRTGRYPAAEHSYDWQLT